MYENVELKTKYGNLIDELLDKKDEDDNVHLDDDERISVYVDELGIVQIIGILE